MYSSCKSVFPASKGLSQASRKVLHLGYPAINHSRSRRSEVSRVSCSNGDGGDGGCPRGAGKFTMPEEPGRPRKNKALAGKLTFEEVSKLAGPTAFFAAVYCLSRSLDLRAVGQGRDYRAAPIGETLEHITVKRKETRDTFGLIMMALAAGAGASNATGQSTTTTIISGIASFSVAVWASSRRRKGE